MSSLPGVADVAQIRHDNAMALFDEFVQQCARNPDPATLRGLERRFAEHLLIQPSYWSQIKGRSRQIGERLARQFEQRCKKPAGWMDTARAAAGHVAAPGPVLASPPAHNAWPDGPENDDERFIVGLVLTYYRRHPQRARTRLLDLLGEVLVPTPAPPAAAVGTAKTVGAAPGPTPPPDESVWLRAQAGVAPLKRKK